MIDGTCHEFCLCSLIWDTDDECIGDTACSADSGGSVISVSDDGVESLVGIIMKGWPSCSGSSDTPVISDVTEVRAWIDEQMGTDSLSTEDNVSEDPEASVTPNIKVGILSLKIKDPSDITLIFWGTVIFLIFLFCLLLYVKVLTDYCKNSWTITVYVKKTYSR